MERLILKIILVALTWTCITSHYVPDIIADITNAENRVIPASCEKARLLSYHIHVMFWPYHQEHVKGALKLRQKFIKHFHLENINCTITAGDPGTPDTPLCVFGIAWEPVGPFTTAQFSFFVPSHRYVETVTYILQNRGIYDVFVHPNSGCATYDHSRWAVWSGHQWPLDMPTLVCDYPGCIVPEKHL